MMPVPEMSESSVDGAPMQSPAAAASGGPPAKPGGKKRAHRPLQLGVEAANAMAGVAPERTQRQAKTRDERARTELESVVAGADGMDARAAKAARTRVTASGVVTTTSGSIEPRLEDDDPEAFPEDVDDPRYEEAMEDAMASTFVEAFDRAARYEVTGPNGEKGYDPTKPLSAAAYLEWEATRNAKEQRALEEGVAAKKARNEQAVASGEEPEPFTRAELEYLDASVARQFGNERPTVSDEDLIEHGLATKQGNGDLGLREPRKPAVTGRGGFKFSQFGCVYNAQHCAGRGHDVATAVEVYETARIKHETANKDDPTVGRDDSIMAGYAEVAKLAAALVGADHDGVCRAFASRVCCANPDCMLAAGVMTVAQREKFNAGEHQDANQANGNKRYGSASLFHDNLCLIRKMFVAGVLEPDGVRALVLDTSQWAFWCEYRQRSAIGCGLCMTKHAADLGAPLVGDARQDFLDRMAAMPMNFVNTVLAEHVLTKFGPEEKYPANIDQKRTGGARLDGCRSWAADLRAFCKQRYPDPLTAIQGWLKVTNWERMGKKEDALGALEDKVFDSHPGRDLYLGARQLAARIHGYLEAQHDAKTWLEHTATQAALLGSNASDTKRAISAISAGAGLKTAGMRAELERFLNEHSDGAKSTTTALVHRSGITNDGTKYAPACNTIQEPNNTEVWHKYVCWAKAWGLDARFGEGWSEGRFPSLFLKPVRGRNKAKGWQVTPSEIVLDNTLPKTRTEALRKDKAMLSLPSYAMPLGIMRRQMQEGFATNTLVRGMPSGVGMVIHKPTDEEAGDGARLFRAATELRAVTRLTTSAKAVCKLLQTMRAPAVYAGGSVVYELGLPSLFHDRTGPGDGLTWFDQMETASTSNEAAERMEMLTTAHECWNALSGQFGELNCKGMRAASGCRIDHLTLNMLAVNRLEAASAMIIKANDEWRGDFFWRKASENGPLPGFCASYTPDLIEHLRQFVNGARALKSELPLAVARCITRVRPQWDTEELGAMANGEPSAELTNDAFKLVKANYQQHVDDQVLDPTRFSLLEYMKVNAVHYFMVGELKRNTAKKRWFQTYLACCEEEGCACKGWRATGWGLDVPDDPCGSSARFPTMASWEKTCDQLKKASLTPDAVVLPPRPRHFGAYCEHRGIDPATRWPTEASERQRFAVQLLAVGEAELNRLAKIAQDHNLSARSRSISWAVYNSWCRKFDETTRKRVLRWARGVAAPDQHTAAYEARFQRELVANFAGGLARESLRRKAIQSGAQSSLFDATACHRAELEAAQSDMTKTERLRAAAEAANVARADREAQRLFDREAAGLPEFDGDDNQGMVRDGDLVSGSGAAAVVDAAHAMPERATDSPPPANDPPEEDQAARNQQFVNDLTKNAAALAIRDFFPDLSDAAFEADAAYDTDDDSLDGQPYHNHRLPPGQQTGLVYQSKAVRNTARAAAAKRAAEGQDEEGGEGGEGDGGWQDDIVPDGAVAPPAPAPPPKRAPKKSKKQKTQEQERTAMADEAMRLASNPKPLTEEQMAAAATSGSLWDYESE